jgi:hypothetical protein
MSNNCVLLKLEEDKFVTQNDKVEALKNFLQNELST